MYLVYKRLIRQLEKGMNTLAHCRKWPDSAGNDKWLTAILNSVI